MFKKFSKLVIAVLICFSFISGLSVCAKEKDMPALELRQLQTRTYEVNDQKLLLEAIINVLQDRGYLINESNFNLGLISGYKECSEKIFLGSRYIRMETSVQVEKFNDKNYKVRTNFIKKLLDISGVPANKVDIKNPEELYRDFFSQLDKSLFIEKQGI